MDTIDTFLDAMFAPYPVTPRLLEAKRELRTMMEDAYADAITSGRSHNEAVGQVITDFGNLKELAPVLGILPEIRQTATTAGQGATPDVGTAGSSTTLPGSRWPGVTLPEAQELAEARRSTGRLLGAGVATLVLAAVPILLAVALAAPSGPWQVGEDDALAITTPLTLLMVAAGVMTLVRRHRTFVGVQRLLDGHFTRDPLVSAWASRQRAANEGQRSRALVAAVGLWITAAIPVVSAGLLSDADPGQDWTTLGAAAALALVALGLFIFLPTTWASSTHETLTEEGMPGGASDGPSSSLTGLVAAVYWPLTVAIYLGWSFLGDAWDRSWVIWPVAGVLFAAVAAVASALSERHHRGT